MITGSYTIRYTRFVFICFVSLHQRLDNIIIVSSRIRQHDRVSLISNSFFFFFFLQARARMGIQKLSTDKFRLTCDRNRLEKKNNSIIYKETFRTFQIRRVMKIKYNNENF